MSLYERPMPRWIAEEPVRLSVADGFAGRDLQSSTRVMVNAGAT
jgi:hypothetical protein